MSGKRGRAAYRVSGSFWVLLALAVTVSPVTVVAAVLAAAALHELGHLAALRHYGVRVRAFRLTALGAELEAPAAARLSYGRELAVTLAGAAVNLLGAAVCAALGAWLWREWLFVCAGAHLALAAFNLLPVVPLDGARAFYLLTAYCFGPAAGALASALVSTAASLALLALGAKLSLGMHSGYLFVFAALGLVWGSVRQLGLAHGGKNV